MWTPATLAAVTATAVKAAMQMDTGDGGGEGGQKQKKRTENEWAYICWFSGIPWSRQSEISPIFNMVDVARNDAKAAAELDAYLSNQNAEDPLLVTTSTQTIKDIKAGNWNGGPWSFTQQATRVRHPLHSGRNQQRRQLA